MWTLDEAIIFAREIGVITASRGWYVNLGGGVLQNGQSNHDLDLVFIPYHAAKVEDLHEALTCLNWKLIRDSETMRTGWKVPDTKHVEEWQLPNGKRVDVILLRTKFS